jgi:hypothetical protein
MNSPSELWTLSREYAFPDSFPGGDSGCGSARQSTVGSHPSAASLVSQFSGLLLDAWVRLPDWSATCFLDMQDQVRFIRRRSLGKRKTTEWNFSRFSARSSSLSL